LAWLWLGSFSLLFSNWDAKHNYIITILNHSAIKNLYVFYLKNI
jgi:hypothetical protein